MKPFLWGTTGCIGLLTLLLVRADAGSQQTALAAAPSPPEQEQALSLRSPTQMPPVVIAGAQAAAHTIAQIKNGTVTGDPHKIFGANYANKILVFALAAAIDPDKARSVDYVAKYIAAGETKRTDKQVGASAGSTGSTSAVDKPGIPYLLGIAIDHGTITQDINGSTLNLSSSPYALIASVSGDTAETYNRFSGYTRLGLSAAFNLQNQSDPLASATRKQLSEWTAKLRLLGDHSPRSKEALAAFNALVLPALQEKVNVSGRIKSEILGGSAARAQMSANFSKDASDRINGYLDGGAYNAAEAEQKITALILDAVQQDIYAQLPAIGLTANDQELLSNFLTRYQSASDAYVKAANAFDSTLAQLAGKPTLTLGYFQERGSGTPNYSVAKLLYERTPKGFMQVDANASASFYHHPLKAQNEQTFRDFTAALALQQNFGRSPFLSNSIDQGQISVSFSGRYERMQENRHVAGKKADLGVANAKIDIPVTTGVTLPISLTYANATELIKENEVRGNFGISFDLDKLRAVVSAR